MRNWIDNEFIFIDDFELILKEFKKWKDNIIFGPKYPNTVIRF